MTAIVPPEENAIRSAATQPTSKATSTVPSGGTVTARVVEPLIVQFPATAVRLTVWGPAITSGKVTAPFASTATSREQPFPGRSTQTS